MLIMTVNQCDFSPIVRNSYWINSSGPLCELEALLFLAGLSIPNERNGRASHLPWDCRCSIRRDCDWGDVICVRFCVVWNIFSLVVNLTTAEKFLCVGILIKNHSKGSGHIHGLSSTIKVDILPWIFTSVAIDIFKGIVDVRRGRVRWIIYNFIKN